MMRRSLVWLGGIALGIAAGFTPLESLNSWLPLQGRSPHPFAAHLSAQAQVSIIIGDRHWQVHERVPELSKGNTYVDRSTQEVDPQNTLVKRLMRYHLYSRGRSPLFRLDWKLTLGDYLGLNETIPIETYPGNGALTQNPRSDDMAALAQLNREQRQRLVAALVDAFAPDEAPDPQNNTPSQNRETPAPPPSSGNATDLL